MYRGLFNPHAELSPADFRAVGLLTVRLLLPWSDWVHRRVERITFTDVDTIRRSNSIDFTLPYWYHQRRGTPKMDRARQVIPIGLVRKGTLVNFSLRDETGGSLPLLTTPQNIEVAEAALVALAEQILEKEVPQKIRRDIHRLVEADAGEEEITLDRLFNGRDGVSAERGLLRDAQIFCSVAEPLAKNFLAVSLLHLGWHERRIIHYAYDEFLSYSRARFANFVAPMIGGSRGAFITVPAASHADSYHVEIEAPEGLQVGTREWFAAYVVGRLPADHIRKVGSFQRSHIHFRQVSLGEQALVLARLYPRTSTIVRGSCVSAALAFATLLFLQLRFDAISTEAGRPAAAAVLLGFQGVVSLYLARTDQNAMTTDLLWPVRLVGAVPGVAAFMAAAVIVAGTTGAATRTFLWLMVGMAGASALALGLSWARIVYRARRPG